MLVKSARFIKSSPSLKECPKPVLPEYAFIGRSNVGKSSLINMLSGIKGLAKTSSTPGKTQIINHYIINNDWYLVDLPGFGYARTAKTNREQWIKMIQNYLLKRENLVTVFLLLDARLDPQENDLDFIGWLGEHELPFILVFTKSDKLAVTQLKKNIQQYKQQLQQSWDELPSLLITSSKLKSGREEILTYIEESNNLFKLNE